MDARQHDLVLSRDGTHAIKILFEGADEKAHRSFFREIEVGRVLNHPHLVTATSEVFIHQGRHAFRLPWIDGVTLARVLEVGPLPPELVLYLGKQVASALLYLHHGTSALPPHAHADLCPQNLMIDRKGTTYLIDLGNVSRIFADGGHRFEGRVGYAAPELIDGMPCSAASDAFALGTILWESSCGRRLFFRHSELATQVAVTELEIPHWPRHERLRVVLQALLSQDQQQRTRALAELASEKSTETNSRALAELSKNIRHRPTDLA